MKTTFVIRTLMTAVILTSGFSGICQVSPTDNTTLNVTLNDVSSITVTPAGQAVTLSYNTPDDYRNGVTLTQASAVKVTSNARYSVTVHALDDLMNGAVSIPVNNVSVKPEVSSSGAIANTMTLTERKIPLGAQSAATIISSDEGTSEQYFNLTYSTANGEASHFLNKTNGTYTTILTYSLTRP